MFVCRWWDVIAKNLRFNMMIKKYNMVYKLINNGALIKVELDLSIVETYVYQHSKS